MNSESRRYGVGIVGCGRAAASLHLPALKKNPAFHVSAIADNDERALRKVADEFDIPHGYSGVAEMLHEAEPDIVAVCVPVQDHVESALPVLRAGKHLLVEKPLALDLAGCDTLIRAASGGASQVMVGFNLRHHRLVQQAKQLIDSGQLGEIEAISSKWTSAIRYRQELPSWRNSRDSGGGALFEIAVHHFDLWRFLLGTEITEIHAAEQSEQWHDETVALTARLANGAVASALFSERSSDCNELEIFGRRGRLSLSLFQYDSLEFMSVGSTPGLAERLRGLTGKLADIPKGVSIMRKGGDFLLSYQGEWQHFLAAIESDTAPQASLADGRAALHAVLAAVESVSTGQPVNL